MSELAVVEIRRAESEYSDNVWCVTAVNGIEWGNSVPVHSREDFEMVAPRLRMLIETVYRLAYREGVEASRATMRAALGIHRNTGS
jgi:hypothetical protein